MTVERRHPITEVVPVVAVPAAVIAYFYSGTVSGLSQDDAVALMLITLGTMFCISSAWEINTPWQRGIAMGSTLLLASFAWNGVLRDAQHSERANDRRCLAIQHDMLSANPLRDDGPDLFEALKCRPQGEGSVFARRKTE